MIVAGQGFLLADAAPPPVAVNGLTPRDYQLTALDALRALIAEGCRRLLAVLATGGGKTVVAALIALGAVQKGRRILFCGPRREIIAQAFWKLVEAGIPELECGVIMADGVIPHAVTRQPYLARRPQAQVQVASIQTLQHRRLPPADVVFIDEAHHATSPTWQKIIDHYTAAGAVIVGLTATPIRADGKGLSGAFDRIHVIAGFAELAAGGYLVIPRVFTTPRGPDLSAVKVNKSGEYDDEPLAEAMDKRQLVGDLVDHWLRLAEGRTTVVFAASVAHSRHIVEQFAAAGILAAHIDANTDPEERDSILGRLHRGEIQVLSNMSVCTEGWDEPRCKCVVLARPTKSLSLFLQMCGRGLRPWENTTALLLDHAGAVREHGFPQDVREWTLEGRKKRKKSPEEAESPMRVCPECDAVIPGAPTVCPECGFGFLLNGTGIEEVEGELVEASPTAKARRTPMAADVKELRGEIYQAVESLARAHTKAFGINGGEAARTINASLKRRFRKPRAELSVDELRDALAWVRALPIPTAAPSSQIPCRSCGDPALPGRATCAPCGRPRPEEYTEQDTAPLESIASVTLTPAAGESDDAFGGRILEAFAEMREIGAAMRSPEGPPPARNTCTGCGRRWYGGGACSRCQGTAPAVRPSIVAAAPPPVEEVLEWSL